MSFDLNDNILDTRDLKIYLDELETIRDEADEANDPESDLTATEREDAWDAWNDVVLEHTMLSEFWDEYSDSDWEHGCTMVNENYFAEYAEEMAGDLYGALVVDGVWPFNHIDWDEAAEALKNDYSEVELDGVTYYVR